MQDDLTGGPLSRQEELAEVRPGLRSAPALARSALSILIVEDDLDVRLGMVLRLKANGYDVVTAGDCSSCLALAESRNVDLILLDLGLPVDDGFVVLQKLKQSSGTSAVPVVVLSGRDPKASRQRALDAGATAFLQKPIDNAALLALLDSILTGRSPS